MNSSTPPNAECSPTSLPGRDHTADADTSLIRKRQRLTPSQHGSNESDSPGRSIESPVVIEVMITESHNTPITEMIVVDDEPRNSGPLETFPFSTDKRDPEQAALLFANLCFDPNRAVDDEQIEQFAGWIQHHLDTDSTAYDHHSYTRRRTFWTHIGRCFDGLTSHISNLHHRSFHTLSCAFARLYANLCEVEVKELEQRTSRRDSVKPASPGKHSLLFCSYLLAFERLALRGVRDWSVQKSQAQPESRNGVVLAFVRQQKGTDAFSRIFALVASRADEVEYSHEILLSYLRLSSWFIVAAHQTENSEETNKTALEGEDSTYNDSQTIHDIAVKTFEVSISKIVPMLAKTSPDNLPLHFHDEVIDKLTRIIELLSPSRLPLALQNAVKDTSEYSSDAEDLLAPEYTRDFALNLPITGLSMSVLFKLQTLNDIIRSGIMTLRVTGLELLNNFLFELWNRHPSENSNTNPILQLTANYLQSTEIVKYLFGPHSHVDLVRRSTRIMEFLAATRNLRKSDADTLWEALFHNQLADIGQASHHVLWSFMPIADYLQAMHFCRKYEDLPPQQIGKPMVALFEQIIITLSKKAPEQSSYFELACVCVRLLQKISLEPKELESINLRASITQDVVKLLGLSGDCAQYQGKLLEMCAAEIKNKTPYATNSVYLFLDLATFPTNELQICAHGILSFQDIIEELCRFVDTRKKQKGEAATSKAALHSRIRLANLTLACNPELCSIETEKTFWDYVIGPDAIDNQAREIAWQALFSDLKLFPCLFGHLERCASLYLPNLSPSHATTSIIFASRMIREKCLETGRFEFPLGSEIIRFALAMPEGSEVNRYIAAILEALFDRHALAYHAAATEIQTVVANRCLDCMIKHEDHNLRAVILLQELLVRSIHFDKVIRATAADTAAKQMTNNPTYDRYRIPVQLYKADGHVLRQDIVVEKHETFLDLQYQLANIANFDDFRVICAGQPLDLAECSTKRVCDSNLIGQALIVKKNNSLQSIQDERSQRGGRTALERAVLLRFDELYAQLDEPNQASEQIFSLLTKLQPTSTWTDISLEESRWRVLFSIQRLGVELEEQIRFGVADASFILKGVQILTDALKKFQHSSDWLLLQLVATNLFKFLRERPVQDFSDKYFEDPVQFVRLTLGVLVRVSQVASMSSEQREIEEIVTTTSFFYQSLLEGVRMNHAVSEAFQMSDDVELSHKKMLLNCISSLSASVADHIMNFCTDSQTPMASKSFFWKIALICVSEAQSDPSISANFYQMAPTILRENKELVSNETKLRDLIDCLNTMLLRVSNQERFGESLVDHRISGLCSLLQTCVDELKAFKKPLDLSHLAGNIFSTFLFPPPAAENGNGDSPTPVLNSVTRQKLYRLVLAFCEDLKTLKTLADLTLETLRLSDIQDGLNYPGREGHGRPDCGYSGLTNLQQTCYMNSLLQQLFMNISFRKFILDTPIVDPIQQVVLHEIKWAFAYMQNSYRLAFCPERLAQALDVDVTMQEDAQIFFTTLLGKLEDSMPDEAAKRTLKTFFGGSNKSQTRGECGHVSESPDAYYNLSLVVKDKSCLQESLQEYVQGAPLEGGDKFKCMTCDTKGDGVYVNALRRTGLEHVPDNLVLGLKRFRYETWDGGEKVNDLFEFPEQIDMNPYKIQSLSNPQQPMDPDIFQLVGVVVHDGTLQYGHYWSYAMERSSASQGSMPWFKFEDRLVNRVSIADVMLETRGGLIKPEVNGQAWLRSDNAYVLFYERLSSLQNSTAQQKTHLDPSTAFCPRVPVPEEMRLHIAEDNEKQLRQMNVFAAEHAGFVCGLLGKFEDISKGRPTEDVHSERLPLELAFEHLHQVTIRTQSLDCLDDISLSLQELTALRPENAIQFIHLLFRLQARDVAERFIFHKKSAVRIKIRTLLVACLRSLREQDPTLYGADADGRLVEGTNTVIRFTTQAHADLLDRLFLSHARVAWPEYFEFATEIAALGFEETSLILDRGYLLWCLEVLFIHSEVTLQAKHNRLWQYIRNNRSYPFHCLSDCVYGLLNEYIDLSDIDRGRVPPPLVSEEIMLLTRQHTSYGASALLLHSLITSKDNDCNGPLKLASLLTNGRRMGPKMATSACSELHRGLQDEDYPVYVDALAYCIFHGCLPPSQLISLIRSVANMPEVFEDVAQTVLSFMRKVYTVQPVEVLSAVPIWIDKLLMCDDADSEDAALKWLDDILLKRFSLEEICGTEELKLFFHHAITINSLAGTLMKSLQENRKSNMEYDDSERIADAFRHCIRWLRSFVGAMEKEFGNEMTHEEGRATIINELHEVAVDASRILEQGREVSTWLSDWADGETNDLAYRSARMLGSLRGRTYDVDTDAELVDLASSEDDDDDDDDDDDEDADEENENEVVEGQERDDDEEAEGEGGAEENEGEE